MSASNIAQRRTVKTLVLYKIVLRIHVAKAFYKTFDAGVVTHGSETQRLHLNVAHSLLVDLIQKSHLLFLAVVTKGAIQTALTYASKYESNIKFVETRNRTEHCHFVSIYI